MTTDLAQPLLLRALPSRRICSPETAFGCPREFLGNRFVYVHSECGHLPLKTLSRIARRVREVTGLKAEVF